MIADRLSIAALMALLRGDVSPSDGRILNASRRDLAAAWAGLGCLQGAEIGVERGEYAERLLRAIPGLRLLAVDAWTAYPGYREHVTQAKLDGFYALTCERLAPYGAQIVRAFSVEAARLVADGSLDFVYLDANHARAHVEADLAAWGPKVRRGGFVAGHDYGRSSVGQVREAVNAWAATHGIRPWILAADRSPSFVWRVA